MSRKRSRAAPTAQPTAPTSKFTPRHAGLLCGALVVAATIATFARGLLDRELLVTWDDARFLRDFAPIRGVSFENLRAIWSEPHFQAFHPFHLMSYWLDVPWAGPDPLVLGGVNVALWALGLLLVQRVIRALASPPGPSDPRASAPRIGPLAATLATLAYGLHPIQVEAVTWATGRKEIVVLIFASLAVLAHLRCERWYDRWAWISRAMYILAALSKTTVLPLPGVLFLVDVLLRGVPWKAAIGRQVPSVVLGLGLSVVVVRIWETEEMTRPDAAGGDLAGRVQLVFATLTHHVKTALFPARLSPIYPIERTADYGVIELGLGVATVASALLLAWRTRSRWLAFAVLGFLVLLLPVLNVVPMYWLRADRYLSLPLLPLAAGFGALVEHTRQRWSYGAPLAGALLVTLLAARTVQHEVIYTRDARLWAHATSVYPTSSFAWLRLGQLRRDNGDLGGAIRAYRRAVELAPQSPLTRASLFYATVLRDEARPDFSPPADFDFAFCRTGPMRWNDHVNMETRAVLESQRAWAALRCYFAALDDPDGLRLLGGEMVRAGYRDSVLLVLDRLFDLVPLTPEQLERAAAVQLRANRRWLARFYLSRLGRPPIDPDLRALMGSE